MTRTHSCLGEGRTANPPAAVAGTATRRSPVRTSARRDSRRIGPNGSFRALVRSRATVALALAVSDRTVGTADLPDFAGRFVPLDGLGVRTQHVSAPRIRDATLWITTEFWVASLAMSMSVILFY